MDEIIIPNKEQFEHKLASLKESGLNNLHVIADFDRTLTKAFVKNEKVKSAYAFIREGHYLTEDYSPKAFALFDEYYPYEVSTTLSLEDKKQKMQEWWEKHLKLLIGSGMNFGVVKDIIDKDKFEERVGLDEFLNLLNKCDVPLLIFSAGLGDFILEFLKREKLLSDNIHLIANFFDFDENSVAKGYKDEFIIHVFNKNEFVLKGHPYINNINNRKNVLLLGDSLGDVNMAEGIDHNTVLKIGFLNDKVEKLKEEYCKHYDLIILNDGSLNEVVKIISNLT